MFATRTYAPVEIRSGLAMFLSPAALANHDATRASASFYLPPTGLDKHYFLVLATEGDKVAITPLTSHPNGTGWIPVTGKQGHHGWVDPPTFYHPSQIWPVTVEALIAAAHDGGDLTRRGYRNSVAGKEVERVVASMFQRSGRLVPVVCGTAEGRGSKEGEVALRDLVRISWRLYWTRYRTGEIWAELRLSSVIFRPARVRFVTGRG